MLELDDIQNLLLTRAPALTARYEFLSFRDGAGGRAWVSAIKEKVHSAASMRDSVDQDKRWVTVAFTWNGLRALGLDEASLASFPEEFKQGMAARAEMLGDAGAHAPEHWVGGLASPDLHAIVILFARDDAEHDRCVSEHEKLIASCPGVEVLSVLDLHAIPPFGYAHEHFGYRDRLSEPAIEGNGVTPSPGTGEPLKPGEFILGYPDEHGVVADSPRPEILARNGSYMAYRRLEEHVGKFRDFLRQHGETAEEQELIAAKLMGVATDAWEQVTGVVVRAMLPEISPGSYFAPQVRYGTDFEGNDDGRLLRQLRIAPTLNINLPHNLFVTLYPSPDVRLNYGAPVHNQTGRLFLPLNFMLGWKPTEHTVISAEFGIPIIKDFPVYTFKA